MKNLAAQNYWDNSYSGFKYYVENDSVTNWLSTKILNLGIKSVFEFGCFPGRYLSYLGLKGFTVSGIDLTPRIDLDFKDWLNNLDISFDEIIRDDAIKYTDKSEKFFDLVCSFGFIEHFENFEEIILCHDRILKKDGYLCLTTPNFKGYLQYNLHKYFDSINLSRHFIPSMDPFIWADLLEKRGYSILYCGYFGGFSFWVDKEKRSFFKKLLLYMILGISKIPGMSRIKSGKNYSPFCGIIAKKNNYEY
ncbi:MAG: class I SAM-dependent methyltransferase [Leadbetterella sp.]|jgi:SAM-dependent methyltransferase|nr:class I SAM-dependent methyltransferase [Leadbetterella sp.]